MWSQYKPPITNWLVLKFFNYWKKTFILSKKKMIILKMMASEINSIFLKKNWIFDKFKIANLFTFNNLNFLSLSLPLTYISFSNDIYVKYIKNKMLISNFIMELINISVKNYFNWNIYKSGWDFGLEKKLLFSNFFLKTIIFQFNKDIFNKKILNFWLFEYNFFYNIYFYKLILLLTHENFLLNFFFFYKMYYYGDFSSTLFVKNFFEWKISIYNRYLSMQKGFSKKTSTFINWHYLFSASTQIPKFSTYNFYKYFFKNTYKIISWNLLFFNNKQKSSKNYDKLTSKSGIFIWNRNLSIIPQYVNKIFYIYNGMRFFKLRVVPAMIGYKFGSFSFTRRILAKDYKLLNSFKNIV